MLSGLKPKLLFEQCPDAPVLDSNCPAATWPIDNQKSEDQPTELSISRLGFNRPVLWFLLTAPLDYIHHYLGFVSPKFWTQILISVDRACRSDMQFRLWSELVPMDFLNLAIFGMRSIDSSQFLSASSSVSDSVEPITSHIGV